MQQLLLLLLTLFTYNLNLICGPVYSTQRGTPDWQELPIYSPPIEFEMLYTPENNPKLTREALRNAILKKFAEENEAARIAITPRNEPDHYRPRISVSLSYHEPLKFWQKSPKQRRLELDHKLEKLIGKINAAGSCQAHLSVMEYKITGYVMTDVSKMM